MKRLLVLNQYYWPGPEATAQLLTELCEGLAGTYAVTVVAGTTRGAGPGRQTRNGVEIVRVPSTSFSRSRLAARAANYLTYVVLAALRGLTARRPDIVLCQTDPPFVGRCRVPRRPPLRRPAGRRRPGPVSRVCGRDGKLSSPLVLQGPRARRSTSTCARPIASWRSARRCVAAWRRAASSPSASP